jgi:hypothetical protein
MGVSKTNSVEIQVGLSFETVKANYIGLRISIDLNLVELMHDRNLTTPQFPHSDNGVMVVKSANSEWSLVYNVAVPANSSSTDHSSYCSNLNFINSFQVLSCISARTLSGLALLPHFIHVFVFKDLLGSSHPNISHSVLFTCLHGVQLTFH